MIGLMLMILFGVNAVETKAFPPETHIQTTQKYDTTIEYHITTSELEPNSMYEIKVHTLGSIPTIFGVSLFEPKQYSTDTNFFDESNLQFHTSSKGCILSNNREECGEVKCFVTLLYMGRTVHPESLEKGVTYFITMKRGPLGLVGNIPILVLLGVLSILIALILARFILKHFESFSTIDKDQ